ncbi:MAG: MBL fold metallo-hydrolase [Paludibacteraceae bacterium]|nr:MBL fold metallo-hydrolase [Paludibacteraceae bacterium]
MAELIFRSFASGSSGNCYYLGTYTRGILIDAGISSRTIRAHLREMGLDFKDIMGVLVTHDHADHIRAVGTLGERFHIPIYANKAIHEGINRNYGLREKLRTCQKYFETGVPFYVGSMAINTFHVSHDSTDCVAYFIQFLGQNFLLATDVGCPSPELAHYIGLANHIVIEANHDEQMLLNGPYPSYLKERILSERGHQSNKVCAQLLADNFHDGIRNIFLCHLSHENNTPEEALDTVANKLTLYDIDVGGAVNLEALEQYNATSIIELK